MRTRLRDAGFKEALASEHRPPVSRYTLGDEGSRGFYAEFLTPLIGRASGRDGAPLATVSVAGVTAQRLRYLEVLLRSPWMVTLDSEWGASTPQELRIPNPVSFIVQKLLIHDLRARDKRAQDLLYIHDTLELFAEALDDLAALWRDEVRRILHDNWIRDLMRTREVLCGALTDVLRDAARIPQDRELDPERMRAMCLAALGELLG